LENGVFCQLQGKAFWKIQRFLGLALVRNMERKVNILGKCKGLGAFWASRVYIFMRNLPFWAGDVNSMRLSVSLSIHSPKASLTARKNFSRASLAYLTHHKHVADIAGALRKEGVRVHQLAG
jgi:hypothetical protein